MASRRRQGQGINSELPVHDGDGAMRTQKGRGTLFSSNSLSVIYLLSMSILILCGLAWTNQARNRELVQDFDAIGHYPVVDPEECGSADEKVLNVFSWARKYGAYIHPNVTTGTFDLEGIKVRGLMANGDIGYRHKIFEMPVHLLLNLEKVRDDPVMGRIYNETPQLHDGLGGLAVYLMRESMNKSTFWRSYICSLPDYVPLPVFFSESKMKKVRSTIPEDQWMNFDNLNERRRDNIEMKFMSIMPRLFEKYPDMFPMREYTYPRFAWACSIIMSRTWGRRIVDPVLQNKTGDQNTSVPSLVPAADMPNHLPAAMQARTVAPVHEGGLPGALYLQAHKKLSNGDQIYISYGPKCNAEFLSNYGFVPFNNTGIDCKHGFELSKSKNATSAKDRVKEWRTKWRAHFAKFYYMLGKASKAQERSWAFKP